jgi:hypothetical protein
MPAFRKKPVMVMAVQWDGHLATLAELEPYQSRVEIDSSGDLLIETLEGTMRAQTSSGGRPGDWVVRGIVGELHPVRDDIFRQTYERV